MMVTKWHLPRPLVSRAFLESTACLQILGQSPFESHRGQGVVNLNWIHQECGKLGITVMREGLLTGPYLVAGVCRGSFLNEGMSDRESWNRGGGEGEGPKILTGKCSFLSETKEERDKPWNIILKPLVIFSLGWASTTEDLDSLVKNSVKLQTVFKSPFMLVGLTLPVDPRQGWWEDSHTPCKRSVSPASSSIHRRSFLWLCVLQTRLSRKT